MNRRWVLARRPDGWPSVEDFRLEEVPVPEPGDGEVLDRTKFLSVDPYMRGRMRDAKSYAPPAVLGEAMVGGAVGEVVSSGHRKFAAGDTVVGSLGWQTHALVRGGALRKFDAAPAPISTALGVLGMPGLTAYFGLFDVIGPSAGETVVVSGGAGAVGSTVGQLAKIAGCRVIGIAGSPAKVSWMVDELGFDGGINYKSDDVAARLRELCPAGVDGYFDNVGGPITDAVFAQLAMWARVAVCGQISQYNDERAEPGPRNLWHLIVKRARVQGFLVFDYAERTAEGLARLGGLLKDGRLRYRETIAEGIESTPAAFIDMMRGKNLGKMLVRVEGGDA